MSINKQRVIEIAKIEAMQKEFGDAVSFTEKDYDEAMAQMPSVAAGLTQEERSPDQPAMRFDCH